ncbi:MmyB family transcriptional regulator [Amycolatopsis dendrobii]|uniref:MmyB-like transcription regulator ligand binding domain-containing protein n=1 Tax=Amycolatopsis dendrobii TaxID=2760662 RepID=A0A7W3VYL3_9PSEU|nr:hypothetical protein [Amycolatopsis dendrobii]
MSAPAAAVHAGPVLRTTVPMDLRHPTLGRVDVDYQVWLQPDSPDHRLEACTPRDAASRDALRLLASR